MKVLMANGVVTTNTDASILGMEICQREIGESIRFVSVRSSISSAKTGAATMSAIRGSPVLKMSP